MTANMKWEKNSLALLSNKRTKAYTRSRADEAFSLPSFTDDDMPVLTSTESPCRSVKVSMPVHHPELEDLEKMKQVMLQHESLFKEQLFELHRLYEVQRRLMADSNRRRPAANHHSESPISSGSVLNGSLMYNYKPDSVSQRMNGTQWDMNNDGIGTGICASLPNASVPDFMKQNTGRTQWDMNGGMNRNWNPNQGPRPEQEPTTQIDMNKPPASRVVEIDLERPAEDYMDIEVEDKSLVRNAIAGQSKSNGTFMMGSQIGCLLGESISSGKDHGSQAMSIHNEFRKENGFSSHQERNSFASKDLIKKEAPFFAKQSSPSQAMPFGGIPGRNPELVHYEEKKVVRPQGYMNDSLHCNDPRAEQKTSKLPHWLLKGSLQSPLKSLPDNNSNSQHQGLPHFLQKRDDRHIQSNGLKEPLNSWLDGRTNPPDKVFPGDSRTSTSLVSFQPNSEGAQKTCSMTQNASFCTRAMQASIIDDKGIAAPAPEAELSRSVNVSGMNPLWNANRSGPPSYQEKVKPSLVQQLLNLNQMPPVALDMNEVASGIDASRQTMNNSWSVTGHLNEMPKRNGNGSSFPAFLPVNRPDASPINFGFSSAFIKTSHETVETIEHVEESSFSGHMPRREEKASGVKAVKFDFDLNVGDEELAEKNSDDSCTTESRIDLTQISFNQEHAIHVPVQNSSNMKGISGVENDKQFLQRKDNNGNVQYADSNCGGSSDPEGAPSGEKGSSGSGLTSCDSRDMAILALTKLRDDSNSSSGDACQSGEGKHLQHYDEPGGFCNNALRRSYLTDLDCPQPMSFTKLLGVDIAEGNTAKASFVSNCTDSNDTFTASVGDATEIAQILLCLRNDGQLAVVEEGHEEERTLMWLADVIPEEAFYGNIAMDIDPDNLVKGQSTEIVQAHAHAASVGEKLDSYEVAVLMLKPISPDIEKKCEPVTQKCDVVEESPPAPSTRRRSARRGKAGKDFQKDVIPSISSLSRQEVSEDMQIIEGLIKSTHTSMTKCCPSPKEDGRSSTSPPRSVPEVAAAAAVAAATTQGNMSKHSGKAKGATKSCKIRKNNNNVVLRVCSWGQSTRRKRMRRRRSHCPQVLTAILF